jgi:reductive dehalogenase
MSDKDPEYNTRMVKKAAAGFGADLVGICRFDKRWVYTKGFDAYRRTEFDIPLTEEFGYVVTLAVAMDYELYRYAPTFVAGGATGVGYSKMALVAGLLGQFLNQLGYRSIPCGNDTAMSIPLAVQAGLGEVGRNGILVTPKYGPRVRLCKVFTDMPLVPDRAVEFGVEEFCEVCRKCATSCPAGAIPQGDRGDGPLNISNAGGTRKWYVDGEKCFKFWSSNGCDCGNCVRACPFNKPDGRLHDASRMVIEKIPALDRLFVRADDLFGYGSPQDAASFWRG